MRQLSIYPLTTPSTNVFFSLSCSLLSKWPHGFPSCLIKNLRINSWVLSFFHFYIQPICKSWWFYLHAHFSLCPSLPSLTLEPQWSFPNTNKTNADKNLSYLLVELKIKSKSSSQTFANWSCPLFDLHVLPHFPPLIFLTYTSSSFCLVAFELAVWSAWNALPASLQHGLVLHDGSLGPLSEIALP